MIYDINFIIKNNDYVINLLIEFDMKYYFLDNDKMN